MPFAVATAETDGRLIERVGRGDRDAFEQLYRRFARPVLAMALRQLGDNGRAEDAAQETFAAVWRSARSYRPERGSGSAWLYAVARHAIIDRARQRREHVADIPDEPSATAGPAEQAEESTCAQRPFGARATASESASSSSSRTGAVSRKRRSRAISTSRSGP